MMNFRQLMTSGSLAALVALSATPAFAVQASDTDSGAVSSTSQSTGASKKSVRAANRAFAKTVQKSLNKTKGLEDTSIAVFGNAKTGKITLAGQVASEDRDRLAVDAAKQVRGVTAVNSKLTLRQQGGG